MWYKNKQMKKSIFLKGIVVVSAKMILALSIFSVIHNTSNKLSYKKAPGKIKGLGSQGMTEYMFNVKKNPVTGIMDYPVMITTQNAVEHKNAVAYKTNAVGLNWTELGSDNVGGRTRALLIDKTNPGIMYSGGVSGGIWKSVDAGGSWVKCTGSDQMENMAVSCITQAADGSIYFGTGEAYTSFHGVPAGGFIGGGIWKSTDGDTFTRLNDTKPTSINSTSVEWVFVNDIEADPVNANRIYAATNKGLRMTDDAGATWTNPPTDPSSFTSVVDAVEVGADGSVIFAAPSGALYTSSGDGNFTKVATGSGFPTGNGRVVLAVAPSDPNYIYASVATSGSKLKGVYRSTDKGANWSIIGAGGSVTFDPLASEASSQGIYDNIIVVFPDNKNHILVAGLIMWEWIENPAIAGGQWYQIESYTGGLHPDIHAVEFHPNNSQLFYVATDGGNYRANYTPANTEQPYQFNGINKNYNVTQYYSIAYEAYGSNGTGVMGGTQDNGTNYISGTGNTVQSSYPTDGGDGFDCEISFVNPNAFFTTVYYGGLSRSSQKGAGNSSAGFYSTRLTTAVTGIGENSSTASFVTPIALYESMNATNSPDSIVFTAGALVQDISGVNGIETSFAGTLTSDQPNASIVPGTVKFVSGSQVVIDDGSGNLTGSVSGASNTIDYNTKAFSFTFASAPSSSSPISATFHPRYNAGAVITVKSKTSNYAFPYTTSSFIDSGASVKIQDIIQSKLVVGFTGNNGIWMTKGCLDFTKNPEWFKISNAVSGTVEAFAWSSNGDILFVGTNSGVLYRISGLAAVKDSLTGEDNSSQKVTVREQIAGFNRSITNLALDHNNADRLLVTLAGYGSSTNIYYCSNATTAPFDGSTANFSSKQGSGSDKLPAMPVYSALFVNNSTNPDLVLVGTDYGVYSTTDITAANPTWTDENAGMAHVPVFALRQQTLPAWNCNNSGIIYVGTFGRGMWKADNYYIPTGIAETDKFKKTDKLSVSVYPNPLNGEGKIAFNLGKAGDVRVTVYDLSGKLFKTILLSKLQAGDQKVDFEASEIPSGTYLLSLNGEGVRASGRFVVAK